MDTNVAGFTPNVTRSAPVKTNPNNSTQTNQGQRADAFAKAAPTAVAAPGSAPAAPVGGTTAPVSPAAAARAASTAPTAPGSVAAAIAMATSGVFFAQAASAAAVTSGKKGSDISGKDDSIDRAKQTQADEKNNLALKDSNSETGNEAGDISGANAANAPSA